MTYLRTLTRLRRLAFVGLIVVLMLGGCRGSAPDAGETPRARPRPVRLRTCLLWNLQALSKAARKAGDHT